jgi:integrase
LGRSRKRVHALLLGFTAWMADRKPRPLRPTSRVTNVSKIRNSIALCEAAGQSFLVADRRMLRFVLGSVSPNPSTQNSYISAFRLFFDFLISEGIRKDNPARELGRPPLLKRLPRPIGIDEVCLYLDAAYKLGVVHYAIACLGLYMGLRRNEIKSCQWAWFFKADGRWWCDVESKGGKNDRKAVHPQVHLAMRRMRDSHRDPTWVFPAPHAARRGWPISHHTVIARHKEILEEAGLLHSTLHQLRHSFATYLRRVPGADIHVVQKALGHSSVKSTEIYAEVLSDEHADTVEQLDFRKIRDDMREKRAAREAGRPKGGNDGGTEGAAG